MNANLGTLFYTIALAGTDNFKSELKNTENSTEQSSGRFTGAFKKIATAAAAYFTADAIISFGKQVVDIASEVSAEASAFEQIMGDYTDKAKGKMNELANNTGMVAERLTPYMTSMTAKFKGLGFDVDKATTLATDGLTLASDAAAFWDKSLDESVSHLNSFINGSYEGGEAIGLFANDTQLASYAVKEGIVKETKAWASLAESKKQATRLQYAQDMMKASGATGQAAKEAGQYANVQANLNEKWRQFQAKIGTPILQNIVIPAMNALSVAVDFLSGMFDSAAENVDYFSHGAEQIVLKFQPRFEAFVKGLMDAWNKYGKPMFDKFLEVLDYLYANTEWVFLYILDTVGLVLDTIGILWKNIGEPIFNVMVDVFMWASDLIIDAIRTIADVFESVIDTINSIYQTIIMPIFDGITYILSKVLVPMWRKSWESVMSIVDRVWGSICKLIINPFENAVDFIWKGVQKIKEFFNFKIKWPKIPLPHFKIKGSFNPIDWLKEGVPKIGIEWYAKGGILNKPTIFGANGNNLMVGGEAGPEAVAPITELKKYMQPDVEAQKDNHNVLLEILKVLSDDDRIKRIVLEVLENSGFKIELDNREVGRIVRKYA